MDGGATSVPSAGHCSARETMPTSARRDRTSRRGHVLPGLTPGEVGKRRVRPSYPPVRGGPTSCPRAAWRTLPRSARSSAGSRFVPAPSGAHPGAAARGGRGRAAGSPLIVRGGGGGGGGGGAPEPGQDVAEAVVAVQLGLALGALDGALEAAAEEALRAGRQEGEGEAGLARRRRWARDPRGTRAPARAAARPRAGAGSGSAPAARSPRRPPADRAPTARPALRGPAHPAPPARPNLAQPSPPHRPRP